VRTRGTLLLLLSSATFACSGPLAKLAMDAGMAPQQVAGVRIGLAGVLMFAGVVVTRPRLLRVRRSDWRLLLAYGLFGVAAVQALYFAGVSRLPVGITMLLEFMSPVLVALWIRFVRRTRLPRATWLGISVALLGLAVMAQVWQGLTLDVIGLLAGIGTALCAASYWLLGEHAGRSLHPLTSVTWGLLIGGLLLSVISPPWDLPFDVLDAPTRLGPVWMVLLEITVVATVVPYVAGMTAFRHIPSNVASVIGVAEPVIATLLAWIVLGQALNVVQIMGGIAILAGAYVAQRASQSTREQNTGDALVGTSAP
jgi:drug/metabolite transporter (DMT)-like permease